MKKRYVILIIFLLLLATITLTACTHEHEYSDWTVEKDASCTESGIQVRICQCGQIESRFTPAVDHTQGTWIIISEPTCTADGLKHLICSSCNLAIQAATIPATGHTEGEWFTIAEPSCTADGWKHQSCASCKLVLQLAAISATGHTEGEWITDIEPTTTQEGSKHQICAICSAILKVDRIPTIPTFLVVLDAGHGGADPGSVVGGVYEKNINLQITYKLKALLESQGVAVILTRGDDVHMSLEDRVACANAYDTQLFVSIHCNFYDDDTSVRGFEVFYYQDKQAKTIAHTILSDLAATAQVKTRSVKKESYAVLKNTTMPAVLLEMGFLTNEEERQRLCNDEYQNMMAESIAGSIIRALGQNN